VGLPERILLGSDEGCRDLVDVGVLRVVVLGAVVVPRVGVPRCVVLGDVLVPRVVVPRCAVLGDVVVPRVLVLGEVLVPLVPLLSVGDRRIVVVRVDG
jgi:hypothetical protein